MTHRHAGGKLLILRGVCPCRPRYLNSGTAITTSRIPWARCTLAFNRLSLTKASLGPHGPSPPRFPEIQVKVKRRPKPDGCAFRKAKGVACEFGAWNPDPCLAHRTRQLNDDAAGQRAGHGTSRTAKVFPVWEWVSAGKSPGHHPTAVVLPQDRFFEFGGADGTHLGEPWMSSNGPKPRPG